MLSDTEERCQNYHFVLTLELYILLKGIKMAIYIKEGHMQYVVYAPRFLKR